MLTRWVRKHQVIHMRDVGKNIQREITRVKRLVRFFQIQSTIQVIGTLTLRFGVRIPRTIVVRSQGMVHLALKVPCHSLVTVERPVGVDWDSGTETVWPIVVALSGALAFPWFGRSVGGRPNVPVFHNEISQMLIRYS